MIDNIPTFLIGCDELPERKQSAIKQLQDNNIEFTYWRGLHGNSSGISTTVPNSYYPDGTPYYCEPFTVSLVINHIFLYQHCLINNYEQVIILEDDFELTPDWKSKMTNMLEVLPSDYDLVYLGWLHEGHPRTYKHYKDCLHHEIDDCIFGTHALLFSKNGLKIASENTRVLKNPIDIDICYNSMPKMNYFLCYPTIIEQKSQVTERQEIWTVR